MHRRASLIWLCLCLFCLPCWGAIVPDGSVVQSEDQASRVPTAPDSVRTPLPLPPSTTVKPKTPKITPTPDLSVSLPSPGPRAGGAFVGTDSGDTANPGESRPLVPLAPVPVSVASNTPQWVALGVFLFLAVGGLLLSQQQGQDQE